MSERKTLAVIGFGVIGSQVYAALTKTGAWDLSVYDVDQRKLESLPPEAVLSEKALLATRYDLVLESASREAAAQLLPGVLQQSSALSLSLSALADAPLREAIRRLCRAHGTSLFIPPGALLGLECFLPLRALLKAVHLTTTKSPRSLDRPSQGGEVLFDGLAAQAVQAYPRNLNVAAALSLYGIGFDRTRVTLVSDPAAKYNRHRVEARGDFGELILDVRSRPDPVNPRTSQVTIQSILGTIEAWRSGRQPATLEDLA